MPLTKDFKHLLKNMEGEYLNKPVPKEYQHVYGKRYSKSEVKSFGYAVAKSKGIKIDLKK
jgi:hypothetical protein